MGAEMYQPIDTVASHHHILARNCTAQNPISESHLVFQIPAHAQEQAHYAVISSDIR